MKEIVPEEGWCLNPDRSPQGDGWLKWICRVGNWLKLFGSTNKTAYVQAGAPSPEEEEVVRRIAVKV